ncbi:hypothetical protein LJC05_00300 [Bacteroides sp. OttesenSCG-928-J23]|nr:hypothetical protein [Bacteroides sp. OttesenSCG-928-J23]MDL2303922.1 hypothetical protein [Bacteroides sp. OttesenSCG-928-D19]
MKKNLLSLSVLVFAALSSCVDNDRDLFVPNEEEVKEAKEILASYKMTVPFEVPIEPGMKTIVQYGDEILYEGNLPMTIQVPRIGDESDTRAEWPSLTWRMEVDVPDESGQHTGYAEVSRYGMLMFEDNPVNTDQDFNDFVCAIAEKISFYRSDVSDKYTAAVKSIKIRPFALGSTFHISLGVEFRDGSGNLLRDFPLTPNGVRSHFFGMGGIINTCRESVYPSGGAEYAPTIINSANLHVRSFLMDETITTSASKDDLYILWYIKTSYDFGVKRYATDASDFIDKGLSPENLLANYKIPFGVFVPGAGISSSSWNPTISWPYERNTIYSAYPQFSNWLMGKVRSPFENPGKVSVFDKSIIGL